MLLVQIEQKESPTYHEKKKANWIGHRTQDVVKEFKKTSLYNVS
jgi:hypothetical protein